MNSPLDDCDGDEDDVPILNDTLPTAFQLASLAISFIASGKCEDEAFAIARRLFERAEEEMMTFETLRSRRRREMVDDMPDCEKQEAEKAEIIHNGLGVVPPQNEDFPLDFKAFAHGILPQRNAADREKWFAEHFLPIYGSRGKPISRIEDIEDWNALLINAAAKRGWSNRSNLKGDAKSLHSKQRRGAIRYKLKRRR